jgi:prephenate dehydrogenase
MMGMALGMTAAPLCELDPFTTPLFSIKSKIVQKILSDNPRLYAEILCHNQKMAGIIDIYGEMFARIKSCVARGDAEGLTAMMKETASRLWPTEK